ncbi:MAG: hypothetical protein ACTSRZ_17550 [Promethearchaeota archaeon]
MKNHNIRKRFNSFSHILNFSVILCCSFLYVIGSTIIAQFVTKYDLNCAIFLFIIIPGIVGIANYKLILNLSIILIKKIYDRPNFVYEIKLILLASLLLRFPYFIHGEIGTDTLVHTTLANLFIQTGKIGYLVSPFSIIQWFPDSVIPSGIIYIANLTILSGIASYESVFLISVFAGLFSTLYFYFLINSFPLNNIFTTRAKKLAIISFLTLPLLLKYTVWFVSGRTMFFMIIPPVIIITLNIVFNNGLKFILKLLLSIMIFFTLILSHGMGRIFFLYIIVLYAVNFTFKKIIIKKKKFLKNYLRWFKFSLPILGMTLFFIPILLLLCGYSALSGLWWISTRTELTSFLWQDITPFNIMCGFIFMFAARMGLVTVFFTLGIIFLPVLKIKNSLKVYKIVVSLFIFFPFLFQSMYFYQSLSSIFVLIGCLLFDSFLNLMNITLPKIKIKKKLFPKKISSNKIMVSFLIGSMLMTGYIEYYRSMGEGRPISSDIIDLSLYLKSQKNQSEKISLISSNGKISNGISAYSDIPTFPMGSTTFLSAFPEHRGQIKYYRRNIDFFDITDLISFSAYGIYRSNSREILHEIYKVIYSNNFDEYTFIKFMHLKKVYNFRYLVHQKSDNWSLLEYLIENNHVSFIKEFGNLNLYILNDISYDNMFSVNISNITDAI